MKLLLFFLLISTGLFSQKKYSFDYLIEYDFQENEKSRVKKRYILTNSKDNTYDLLVWQSSAKNINIFFCVDLEGIRILKHIPARDLFSNEKLFINCNDYIVGRISSIYNDKKYRFTVHRDSMMLTDTLQHYQMDIISKKLKKQYKFGTSHYLVEKETQFHLPLMRFSEKFDARITSKNIPNGIANEMYTINDFRHTKEYHYKLVNYVKIEKEIIISNHCEQQNSK